MIFNFSRGHSSLSRESQDDLPGRRASQCDFSHSPAFLYPVFFAQTKQTHPTDPSFYRGRSTKGDGLMKKILVLGFAILLAASVAACGGVALNTGAVNAPAANSAASANSNSASHETAAENADVVASVQPHKVFDPVLPAATADKIKNVTIHVKDVTTEIAPGVAVDLWTYDGTVPGSIVHVNQGDTVKFTLVNDGAIEHSIDFHAAQTPWNKNYVSIKPGQSLSFDWQANYPGVFMYHCGTPPVIHHIANGMYGAIVVSSPDLKPVSKEYVLVQSEYYLKKGENSLMHTDSAKASAAAAPDYVVFNGYANQYKDAPLSAQPGERIRLWVLNAGPTIPSAFHVIGAVFDTVYPDGNPQNALHGMQTVNVPPGGGYMVELTIPEAGLYPFVTHAFAYTGKGALGVIKVGDGGGASAANMSH